MSVATLPEIMDPAFKQRYGVAAFNAVDDLTTDALIKAAEKARSPLIIQISVKTVQYWARQSSGTSSPTWPAGHPFP